MGYGSFSEVDACAFESWFPKFKKFSMGSRIIPMDDAFIDYLKDKGPLFLPSREMHSSSDSNNTKKETSTSSSRPNFPELMDRIDKAIKQLGGAALPKLNWSSPKDAAWIAPNQQMRSQSADDVMLLLKSSECVQHDLSMPYHHCIDENGSEKRTVTYNLVLRHWMDMNPSFEFRCFVSNHKLFGQYAFHMERKCTFLNCLLATKNSVQNLSLLPCQQVILNTIAITQRYDDLYDGSIFQERDAILKGRIWLIDFNPMSQAWCSGMFSWEEIEGKYATDEEIEELLKVHESTDPKQSDEEPDDQSPNWERSATDDINRHLLVQLHDIMQDVDKDTTSTLPKPLINVIKTSTLMNNSSDETTRETSKGSDSSDWQEYSKGEIGSQSTVGISDDVDEISDEEESVAIRRVEIRVVREKKTITSAKFASHAFPRDVVEIASTGDVNTMVEAMKLALDQQNEDKEEDHNEVDNHDDGDYDDDDWSDDEED
eukprot:gene4332-6636_t